MKRSMLAFVILLAACSKKDENNYNYPPSPPTVQPYGVSLTIDSVTTLIDTANTYACNVDNGCALCNIGIDADIDEYMIQLTALDSTDPVNIKRFAFTFNVQGQLPGGLYIFDSATHYYSLIDKGKTLILSYFGNVEYSDSSGVYTFSAIPIEINFDGGSMRGSFKDSILIDWNTGRTKHIWGNFYVKFRH